MDGLTRANGSSGTGRDQAPAPEAVYCQVCGAPSHPVAAFCAACGTPLRATGGRALPQGAPPAPGTPVQWEYADVRIPLGPGGISPADEGYLDAFDAVMSAALAAYGAEGWEPITPIEYLEALDAQRLIAGLRGSWWMPTFLRTPMAREIVVRFRRVT
jgi:hypothetical protein